MDTILKLKLTLILPFTFQCGSVTNECYGPLETVKVTPQPTGTLIRWSGTLECDHESHKQSPYTAEIYNRLFTSAEQLSVAGQSVPTNQSFYITTETPTNIIPVSYSCITYSSTLPPLPSLYLKLSTERRPNK